MYAGLPKAFFMPFENDRFAVTGVFDSDYAVLNPALAWIIQGDMSESIGFMRESR